LIVVPRVNGIWFVSMQPKKKKKKSLETSHGLELFPKENG
jgi:hypothetical protein